LLGKNEACSSGAKIMPGLGGNRVLAQAGLMYNFVLLFDWAKFQNHKFQNPKFQILNSILEL
jgi:hypothetical protein